ncbi:enoyl-CoA hydratase [Neoroseomonas soli]|uniref:Enoyl-CoA hydratase n=1 Tax=Neoroseomonas soli TaxID=1081025 RepID=A0A9X9WXC9_9PROT|nr:enoyl-CoA hydratase [Neoroseomonas soli]MBR0671808.1 enoyl-CoA hydratase [Neoroseomonas soli]
MAGRMDVRRSHEGRVAHVAVDHDAKLNTLNPDLMREFAATFAALAKEPSLRAVVLTGVGGRAFIGGADISVMAGIPGEVAAQDFIRLVHGCCRAVRDLPVPVIARVNGWCLGAGLEVAAACDLRIAAEGAKFGMPEVRVGIPSVVEAALLPGLIGWGRTRRLLLLAETIGAREAEDWGLVERVVPDAALDAAVEEWLDLLLDAGPEAIRGQKALIRKWEDSTVTQGIAAGVEAFGASWRSDEPGRMLGAFMANKKKSAKP